MKKPKPIVVSTTRTVTSETTIVLCGDAIRHLLSEGGFDLPDDASVTLHVPGGADWSNTDLDITTEHPIVVKWSSVHEE